MANPTNSKTSWWQIETGGDVPGDWGLTCHTCHHVICTCSLYAAGDLKQTTGTPWWDPSK